jgi:hypothetical protein
VSIARALLVLGSLGHLIIYLVAAPEHVADIGWPAHARFHVLEAIFWVAGLDLAAVALACWPLPRGERWSLWALVGVWMTGHVSYFAAVALLPAGRPPNLSADVSLGAAFAIYSAGLALAFFRRRAAVEAG